MWIQITIIIFIIIIATGLAVYLYYRQRDIYELRLKTLVNKINAANQYSYEYDKGQEKNIKNLEENLTNVNDTLSGVQEEMLRIKDNALTKSDLSKTVQTNNVVANTINLGNFKISSTNTGVASSDDWLKLYKGKEIAGGINVDKIKVNNSAEVGGEMTIKKALNVGDNIVMTGTNKWMLQTPDDGRTSMYISPGAGGTSDDWKLDKQFIFENDGYMSIYGGGLKIKGGSSKYNPDMLATHFPFKDDGKNYIRGDTEVRGDLDVVGSLKAIRNDPGPMVEKIYGANLGNRYGMGQFEKGTMRVYTASEFGPASLNLSLAKKDGSFHDVVKLRTDKSVEVTGPAVFTQPIQTNEIQFSPLSTDQYGIKKVTSGNKGALRVTINDDSNGSGNNQAFEVWSSGGGSANTGKKLASVTASGLLCLGDNICMKDTKGVLNICDNAGANCKKIHTD